MILMLLRIRAKICQSGINPRLIKQVNNLKIIQVLRKKKDLFRITILKIFSLRFNYRVYITYMKFRLPRKLESQDPVNIKILGRLNITPWLNLRRAFEE